MHTTSTNISSYKMLSFNQILFRIMTWQKSQGGILKLKLKYQHWKKPWSFTWLEWCTPEPIGPAEGCGWPRSNEVCGDNSLVLLSCECTLPGKPPIGWYWGYGVWPTTGCANCPVNWPGALPAPSVGGTDICMIAGSLGREGTLFSTLMSLMSEPRNRM